jgi:MoxR-like ATPase
MHIGEAKKIVKLLLQSETQRITPFIKGHPGIGKSAIIYQLKDELEFDHIIDLRLSQHDNTDIKGVPSKFENKAGHTRLDWLSPSFMPLEGSDFEGTSGILFIDEINRADPQTLQSVFQLIYDRAVGTKKLLPKWKMVAAGNRGFDDGTDVFEMDAALLNRFAMIDVDDKVHLGTWMDWAAKSNVHRSVVTFIDKNPSLLYITDEGKYVTPRSYEMLSNILNDNKGAELGVAKLLARTVIHNATPQFLSHLEMSKTVSPEDVINSYSKAKKELLTMDRMLIYSLSSEINHVLKSDYKTLTEPQAVNLGNYFREVLTDQDHRVAFFTEMSKNKEIFEIFLKQIPEANAANSALTAIMLQSIFPKS